MNELILNDQIIRTDHPAGITLLDFIRYEQHLKGTKIGCREGDCGACTVLIGTLVDGRVHYQSVTSCISPLGNAFGKHLVTIDGLKMEGLSRVQKALVSEGGTQCGFCTPGFAVSLTGYCLSCNKPDKTEAIAAIDGNICRCTGYKSIERSVDLITSALKGSHSLKALVKNKFLPSYFLGIPKQLGSLHHRRIAAKAGRTNIGGGTDLYVQRPDEMAGIPINLFTGKRDLSGIEVKGNTCRIGASTTATDLLESDDMNRYFPDLKKHLKLVSSTQIRNMGTVAGNFVNASPIGDLTIFFLALDSTVILRNAKNETRATPLRKFYLGYKKLAKEPDEIIQAVEFEVPGKSTHFNFEKVCKRTHLDIASVNSALCLSVTGDRIDEAHLAAGGIGPIPTYLTEASQALAGSVLNARTVKAAAKIIAREISPISDVRGSADYKKLLLRQLFFAHFLELFPDKFTLAGLI